MELQQRHIDSTNTIFKLLISYQGIQSSCSRPTSTFQKDLHAQALRVAVGVIIGAGKYRDASESPLRAKQDLHWVPFIAVAAAPQDMPSVMLAVHNPEHDDVDRPVTLPNVPWGHGVHEFTAPGAAEYRPSGHTPAAEVAPVTSKPEMNRTHQGGVDREL